MRSQFLGERIQQLLQRLVEEGLIDNCDVKRVGMLYQELLEEGKITNSGVLSPAKIVGSMK